MRTEGCRTCWPLKTDGKHAKEGQRRDRAQPGDLEDAVVGYGRRADPHAAPVARAVADRHQHPLSLISRAVDGDVVGDRPEGGELAQDRDVVALPAQSCHGVRALVDRRVESARQHAEEVALGSVGGACHARGRRPRRSPRGQAATRWAAAASGSPTGKPSIGGDVVTRAARDDAQRHLGVREGLDDGVHRAVAAACHDGGCARRPRPRRRPPRSPRAEAG